MNDDATNTELTHEERLKAITYQFIRLYERFAEDRQLAAKLGAETAEVLKQFRGQVDAFKQLEPMVRQVIAQSIQSAADSAVKSIGDKLDIATTKAVEKTIQRLSMSVDKAGQSLHAYQSELKYSHWRVIGISCITTVVTSLLIVWLFLPKPTLPLTTQQTQELYLGSVATMIWPTLSKKERAHLSNVANTMEREKINKLKENIQKAENIAS